MPFTKAELKERQQYLGASECSAALGMSSFFTPLQLYMSKLGQGDPIEETLPMMVGHALEPVTLRLFEKEYGCSVQDHQARHTDPTAPWRRATIDGFWPEENAVIEAKTSGDFRGWGMGEDEVPLPYYYNIHHTFMCMPGVTKAFFPVLIGGRTFKVYEVQRSEKIVDLVRAGEGIFWTNLERAEPPPPTNVEDLKILYPRDYGKSREATAQEAAEIGSLKTAKAVRKQAEAHEEEIANAVRAMIGEHAALMGANGKPLVTWKSQTSNRIDVTRLRAEQPAVATEYTISGSQRVLLVK